MEHDTGHKRVVVVNIWLRFFMSKKKQKSMETTYTRDWPSRRGKRRRRRADPTSRRWQVAVHLRRAPSDRGREKTKTITTICSPLWARHCVHRVASGVHTPCFRFIRQKRSAPAWDGGFRRKFKKKHLPPWTWVRRVLRRRGEGSWQKIWKL